MFCTLTLAVSPLSRKSIAICGADFCACVTEIMTYMPITAFRRPIDAVQMAHQQAARAPLPSQVVNKWDVLRELTTARTRLDLSHRVLAVLQALLSFHPGNDLGEDPSKLVVFPSNASICERLNGMPCSTMRRHLGILVHLGLIQRRDSPNGKRFARSDAQGREAYGFDLTPLMRRFSEICDLSAKVQAEAQAYKRLRQSVSLMRRDLAGLAAYGAQTRPLPLWDRLEDLSQNTARILRRKLTIDELKNLEALLSAALNEARDHLDTRQTKSEVPSTTPVLSTSATHFEQHHHSSNKDTYESEPGLDQKVPKPSDRAQEPNPPHMPLPVVQDACPKVQTYACDPIRHWHQLINAAETLRPMMGITPSAWSDAVRIMGPENAATVIAAMLERFTELRSPGAYLRSLTTKASKGTFSTGPMIRALLRKHGTTI